MHHTYFRTVLDDNVLLDGAVLLDFLFEDQVPLDFVQELLTLDNIATIEGLPFQCDSVDCLSYFLLQLAHKLLNMLVHKYGFFHTLKLLHSKMARLVTHTHTQADPMDSYG